MVSLSHSCGDTDDFLLSDKHKFSVKIERTILTG